MRANTRAAWIILAALGVLLALIGPVRFVVLLPFFFITYGLQRLNWRIRKTVRPIAAAHLVSLPICLGLYGLGEFGMTPFQEAVVRIAPTYLLAQLFWLFVDLYVARNITSGLTTAVTNYSPTQRVLNRNFRLGIPSTEPETAAVLHGREGPHGQLWSGRMGAGAWAIVVIAFTFMAKVAPYIVGYVAGRAGVSAIRFVASRSDPMYRAITSGFRAGGLDAESTFKALGPRADSSWFYDQSALRTNTHLAGGDLRELLGIRQHLLQTLTVPLCAGWAKGSPAVSGELQRAFKALPDSVRLRISYLSGLAIARSLRDTSALAPVTPDADSMMAVMKRHATGEELTSILNWAESPDSASDAATCSAALAMYGVALRAPFPSSDADVLMAFVIGR